MSLDVGIVETYQTLHDALAPYYRYIRLVHIPAALLWGFSVTVGFVYYLVPVMQAWRRSEDDPELIRMRNWVFERFDQGIGVEHIAFPLLFISGILLIIAGGWGPESGWLVLKLSVVTALVLPIEIIDYYISHGNGNKRYLRDKNEVPDWEAYEDALHWHWWFFLVTTPTILVILGSVFFLAIVKPF